MRKDLPLKVQLVDELARTYHPDTHNLWVVAEQRKRMSDIYVPWPKVDCLWPAPYVVTTTVKVYKAAVLTSKSAQSETISTEQVTAIPPMIVCVQCRDSFHTMQAFTEHVGRPKPDEQLTQISLEEVK